MKKYLFENFSYTFFPSNFDIEICIQGENIKSFEVFGTPDAKRVQEYNQGFQNDKKVITRTKTSFPSELEIGGDGQIKQFGGLVIVKLNLKEKKESFKAQINLQYQGKNG